MSSNEQQKSSKPPDFPWTQPNGVYATYDLHCHCGAVRYKMKLSPPLYAEQTEGKEQCVAVECGCSHCERNGYLAVHPIAKDVEFTQGQDDIQKYYSAVKKNPHWFCKHCGNVVCTDLTYLMTEVLGMENRLTINVRVMH